MLPSTWNFIPTWRTPFWNGDFQAIFCRTISVVKISEKRSLSLIGSRHELSNKANMNILRCLWAPKGGGGVKNAKWLSFCRFVLGISQKVCYKVALCANCQRQSCKAFTGLSIRAQIVGGGHPLKYKFCSWTEPPVSAASLHPCQVPWHFNRCLLTGETNCNSNLQQCSLNTENNIDICATTVSSPDNSLVPSLILHGSRSSEFGIDLRLWGALVSSNESEI